MSDFRLGPLQTKWIQSLRDHPERQLKGSLGNRYADGSYKACCLGEAGLIAGVCFWREDGRLTTIDGAPALTSLESTLVLDNKTHEANGISRRERF